MGREKHAATPLKATAMTKAEAEKKFADADLFYREDRYTEALALLDDLDRAYPNDRNIMYPRARCLSKMDRHDEALELCNQLILTHQHDRAQELKSRILERDKTGMVTEEDFGSLLDSLELSKPKPARVLAPSAPGWTAILLVSAVVIGVLVAELVWIFKG